MLSQKELESIKVGDRIVFSEYDSDSHTYYDTEEVVKESNVNRKDCETVFEDYVITTTNKKINYEDIKRVYSKDRLSPDEMQYKELVCAVCEYMGFDDLFPYTDLKAIEQAVKDRADYYMDVRLAALRKEITLKKQIRKLEAELKRANAEIVRLRAEWLGAR